MPIVKAKKEIDALQKGQKMELITTNKGSGQRRTGRGETGWTRDPFGGRKGRRISLPHQKGLNGDIKDLSNLNGSDALPLLP